MLVQKAVRDRGRRGVELHHTDYNSALPIRPVETERVSLYHEEIKQLENKYAHLSEDAVKKVARSMALSTLADHQFEAFVNHHLGEVGNMQVVETPALLPDDAEVEWVTEQRREAIKDERVSKSKLAVEYLTNRNLYTSHEIRIESNRAGFTQIEQIAHEYANGLARAVGWNDTVDRDTDNPFEGILDDTDITVAVSLAAQNIQPERLEKIRRGYLAVHYPKWVTAVFERELEETTSDVVSAGAGREITAITDDRFLGEVLTALLNRLKDEVFNSDESLCNRYPGSLRYRQPRPNTLRKDQTGGLGAKAYQRARFLNIADDTYVINWARTFIKEFYPATLSKRRNSYALVHDKKTTLILSSFKCWLAQRMEGEVPELATGFDQLDPQVDLKAQVWERRKAGALLETIAAEFDIAIGTVSEWCKDIEVAKETVRGTATKRRAAKDEEDAQLRIRALQLKDTGLSLRKIADELNISRRKLNRLLKT